MKNEEEEIVYDTVEEMDVKDLCVFYQLATDANDEETRSEILAEMEKRGIKDKIFSAIETGFIKIEAITEDEFEKETKNTSQFGRKKVK